MLDTSKSLRALLLASALLAAALPAQQTAPDTTGVKRSTEPLFTSRDAWIAGGFVVTTVLLFPLDKHIAQNLQDQHNQSNRFFHHQATNVRLIAQPGALIIGGSMYAVGRLAHVERMADLGLHGTEAIIVGTIVTGAIKGTAGRARPFLGTDKPHDFKLGRGFGNGDYSSFPSGHTLAGFAAASAVTSETHRWWPSSTWYIAPVMYGGASLIGLSRMYNNKHWASDVAMGALIGTFSGRKVVQYHHSHPHNRIDRWLLGASIVPTDNGWALAFSATPPSVIR
ncbi:MAG: phosphatase PAP2 family protein [Gemmatimonadaceae bacterium]|nr:phosphatase PAP2 family protein [Gemmatimonadaceae bacterium]NUQ92564.1 phosphatase PAP2 family protein [Gemmatimonadaceae bacterium]NUR18789.1 phosphatase PAP2 family protein [Gemmatimonadaceae bacterium]NUS97388.1 phosphatase PAP2 family protein [Gemmatimonadaceae bacterium]